MSQPGPEGTPPSQGGSDPPLPRTGQSGKELIPEEERADCGSSASAGTNPDGTPTAGPFPPPSAELSDRRQEKKNPTNLLTKLGENPKTSETQRQGNSQGAKGLPAPP